MGPPPLILTPSVCTQEQKVIISSFVLLLHWHIWWWILCSFSEFIQSSALLLQFNQVHSAYNVHVLFAQPLPMLDLAESYSLPLSFRMRKPLLPSICPCYSPQLLGLRNRLYCFLRGFLIYFPPLSRWFVPLFKSLVLRLAPFSATLFISEM